MGNGFHNNKPVRVNPAPVEPAQLWKSSVLGIELFEARLLTHKFGKHIHDAYTIGLNETCLRSAQAEKGRLGVKRDRGQQAASSVRSAAVPVWYREVEMRVVVLFPFVVAAVCVLTLIGCGAEEPGDAQAANSLGEAEESPVEFLFVVPLVVDGELAAHEQQRLAGLAPLVAIERPKARELLPAIPRLLGE